MGRASSSIRGNMKKEVAGVILAAFTLLLVLSLFSFNPDDPSFNNQFSEPQRATNMAGSVGAYLSDLFFQAFGIVAFLWPVAFALLAWKLFVLPELNCNQPAKIASWIILLVSGSSASSPLESER